MQNEINRLTALVSKLQNKLDLIGIEIIDNKCSNCSNECDIYNDCLYQRLNKILKDNEQL